MASKNNSSMALFLVLNLLFFTFSSACDSCPKPTPSPSKGTCPIDTLKFGVCANVLGSLIGIITGHPPIKPCCSLIEGLVDLEAAVCLCTALKADVLGIHLDVPLSLTLLLNVCSKKVPEGFVCA